MICQPRPLPHLLLYDDWFPHPRRRSRLQAPGHAPYAKRFRNACSRGRTEDHRGVRLSGGVGDAVCASRFDLIIPRSRGGDLPGVGQTDSFHGVDAPPVTTVIALLLGIIIVTQAGTQLPRPGAGDWWEVIVVTVIRELGPWSRVYCGWAFRVGHCH